MTTLRLHIDFDGNKSTLVFDTLPVRIGRDETNECRLEFAFVSRRHCRLEIQQGRLVLRDEGSRQGTWIRGGEERLQPAKIQELAPLGYEFQIGALRFRAELTEEASTDVIRPAPEPLAGGTADLGEGADDAVAFRRLPSPPTHEGPAVAPAAPGGQPLEASFERALVQYRQVCGVLAQLLRQSLAREPARASQLAETVQRAGVVLRRFIVPPAGGVTLEAEPALESFALGQLQRLAKQCVPHMDPPSTATDVTAFVNRVGAVLAATLDGIASLRLAYRCETAGPPTEPSRAFLAASLLDCSADWSALEELRGELGEMIIHHNRLVDEMNTAWGDVLALFDPGAMERTCPTPRWSPFRHRALWKELTRRHELLVRERPATGSTFDNVVRALRGAGSPSSRPPAADPPGIVRYGILAA